MERSTTEKVDDLSEGLGLILSIGGEETHAYGMPQDSDNRAENGKLGEARLRKEFTPTEKVPETPADADRASGGASNEECFLHLTHLEDTGEKNCIKRQKGTSESPEAETPGTCEHFCKGPVGSGEQTADEGSGPEGLPVPGKAFDSKSCKTRVKGHIADAGFSEQLSGTWEQRVHPSSPVVPDGEDSEGDVFRICSFSQNGLAADKAEKRTSDSDSISEKGQCEEQLASSVKHDGKNSSEQDSLVSKKDGRIEETDKRNFREETYSGPESLSISSLGKSEDIKANVKTTPCYMLLENAHHKKREKGTYCLELQNAKKLPPKPQNDKDAILKKLQVVLCDCLNKSFKENPGKPLQIENAERPLENERVNEAQRVLDLNSPTEILNSGGSGIAGTSIGHNTEKTGSRISSPEIDALCEQGVFARLSFMDSDHENSPTDLCHIQEGERVTESWQGDSVLISGPPRLKTPEMFMEYRNKLVKHNHREDTHHRAEEHQETCGSAFSGEAVIEDVAQPSGVKLSSVSHGKMDSACSLSASFGETKFSNISSASPLPDKTGHEDILQGEFEPDVVSSHLRDLLKLELEDMIPSKNKIKTSGDRRIAPVCSGLGEKMDEDQVDVEEHETVCQSDSISRNRSPDSCWVLLERDEGIAEQVAVYVTEEEGQPECGDAHLDRGADGPQSEGKPTCRSLGEYAAGIKHSAIRKGITADEGGHDGEVNSAEEDMNPRPSRNNSPLGKLSGSTVKLLGTPSSNGDVFSLGKLIELEDSSDDQESERSIASLSPGSKSEGNLYSASRPVNVDDSKSEKRRQRPNISAAPTPCSQLSQEQSRIKVVDALRETLQKRLDASPDLIVQKNTVSKVATRVEREIFRLSCCVDQHYRKKYRRLLFNLKLPENQPLFRRVVLGEITPKRLVQMTSLEMAPRELAEWRAKENKRVLEVIRKEEQEAPRFCSAKFTHKGIVEIERETEEDLTFQETFESRSLEGISSSESLMELERDPGGNADCFKCPGQMTADGETRLKPCTNKCNLNWKTNASRRLYSEGEGKPSQDSPVSPGVAKKRRVEEKSRTSAIWKGLIHMFSIKQFWAKAYPVSGSGGLLCQGLPHLLQSRGCIVPEDVWAYVDSIWPANSKEMGVIRFHPSLPKSSSPYNMLYTYLNNKQRYGVVDSSMEIFMVPLAAYQPVPSKFHPLGGPGLDPSHPSLLLGLILPKRTCRSVLEAKVSPLPKAKKKTITFSNSTETRCSPFPSRSQGDASQSWLVGPPSTDGLLRGRKSRAESTMPQQEPLTLLGLLSLNEELGTQMLPRDPSSLHPERPGGEASLVTLVEPLQSLTGPPWTGGQLGNLTLELVGPQPYQDGNQVQLYSDSEPSQFWNTLGLLILPEAVGPDQHRTSGAPAPNILTDPFLPGMLSAEAAAPCEASQVLPAPQILCTSSVAGESSSLAEELLSLIQHVGQLQSHIQNQEPQPAPLAFSLPTVPPETASAFSQAEAGADGTYAHLQPLLSALSGPTPPPSAL